MRCLNISHNNNDLNQSKLSSRSQSKFKKVNLKKKINQINQIEMQKSLLKLQSVQKINKSSIKGSRISDFKNQSQEYLNKSGFFNSNNKEDNYINDSRVESVIISSSNTNINHINNNNHINNSNNNNNNNINNNVNNNNNSDKNNNNNNNYNHNNNNNNHININNTSNTNHIINNNKPTHSYPYQQVDTSLIKYSTTTKVAQPYNNLYKQQRPQSQSINLSQSQHRSNLIFSQRFIHMNNKLPFNLNSPLSHINCILSRLNGMAKFIKEVFRQIVSNSVDVDINSNNNNHNDNDKRNIEYEFERLTNQYENFVQQWGNKVQITVANIQSTKRMFFIQRINSKGNQANLTNNKINISSNNNINLINNNNNNISNNNKIQNYDNNNFNNNEKGPNAFKNHFIKSLRNNNQQQKKVTKIDNIPHQNTQLLMKNNTQNYNNSMNNNSNNSNNINNINNINNNINAAGPNTTKNQDSSFYSNENIVPSEQFSYINEQRSSKIKFNRSKDKKLSRSVKKIQQRIVTLKQNLLNNPI